MGNLLNILGKMFKLIKEIKDREGNLHFQRYQILKTPWFSICIHRIFQHDKDPFCHDHPWDFWSLILKGCYTEETVLKNDEGSFIYSYRKRSPFSFKYHQAEDFHKLAVVVKGPVTTLVILKPRKRAWGYHLPSSKYKEYRGEWIDNETFRKLKNNP
jgi:hypothetical protein